MPYIKGFDSDTWSGIKKSVFLYRQCFDKKKKVTRKTIFACKHTYFILRAENTDNFVYKGSATVWNRRKMEEREDPIFETNQKLLSTKIRFTVITATIGFRPLTTGYRQIQFRFRLTVVVICSVLISISVFRNPACTFSILISYYPSVRYRFQRQFRFFSVSLGPFNFVVITLADRNPGSTIDVVHVFPINGWQIIILYNTKQWRELTFSVIEYGKK